MEMPNAALFTELAQAIRRATRVLVISDGKPDGDSLGSATALYGWLKRENKPASLFCAKPVPFSFRFLDHSHAVSNDPHVFREPFDLLITCDASNLHQCGIAEHLSRIPVTYTLAMIDHHATNHGFGSINVLVKDACSTAEIVYRYFCDQNIMIDSAMATSLLTGIFTDTSGFSNQATTQKGMEAASYLICRGARYHDMIRSVVQNKSVSTIKLWGLALSRLEQHAHMDIATTYLTHDDLTEAHVSDESVEGISNFIHGVCGGCDMVLVLRELPDRSQKGSLRGLTKNVAEIAKLFGGGGHILAAGFTTLASREDILKTIERYLLQKENFVTDKSCVL